MFNTNQKITSIESGWSWQLWILTEFVINLTASTVTSPPCLSSLEKIDLRAEQHSSLNNYVDSRYISYMKIWNKIILENGNWIQNYFIYFSTYETNLFIYFWCVSQTNTNSWSLKEGKASIKNAYEAIRKKYIQDKYATRDYPNGKKLIASKNMLQELRKAYKKNPSVLKELGG